MPAAIQGEIQRLAQATYLILIRMMMLSAAFTRPQYLLGT